ncbi:MAG: hypothetical protein JWQ18_1563 [Conexibacter sp.]|nr:hypothetical protein [Conexibacter sp.]
MRPAAPPLPLGTVRLTIAGREYDRLQRAAQRAVCSRADVLSAAVALVDELDTDALREAVRRARAARLKVAAEAGR